ncbi:MAG: hypothetical protein ACLFP4_00800 [Spirochaetales bacterium]
MKKLLVVLVLVVAVTGMASAMDFWIGGNAHFASVIQPDDVKNVRPEGLAPSDFAFGAEGRLYLNALTGSAVATFLPGSSFRAPRVALLTDVGLTLELPLIRAGIGVGPNFLVAFGDDTQAARAGANLRATADVVLGELSLGLSWFTNVELTGQSIGEAFSDPSGFLGITILQKL